MLVKASALSGFAIHATDGELGTVAQFYFDDETWAVRYIVADTGGWLGGRRVLLSPISVIATHWDARRISVSLTREQVEKSPDVNLHLPVSRQREAEFHQYFGYPYYWGGPYLWGAAYYPADVTIPPNSPDTLVDRFHQESQDSHLRSTEAVTGYHIQGTDGEVGHLDGFIVDDLTWAIRYIEVATRNWWPGRKVLLAPGWIERISWPDSKVFVGLNRETIRGAPEYLDSTPVTRYYEERLYLYYGLPTYWQGESERGFSAGRAAE